MVDTLKILGQSKPVALTLTDLYTVPASTSAVVSSIYVANLSGAAFNTSFRISVAIGGAADSLSQYLYFDVPLSGNDTFVTTTGLSLATGDKIRVYTSGSTLNFTAAGVEVT
jgi:hypothetical protein